MFYNSNNFNNLICRVMLKEDREKKSVCNTLLKVNNTGNKNP